MNSKSKIYKNSKTISERGTFKHEVHKTVDDVLSHLYSYDSILLDCVSELQHNFESFDHHDRANNDPRDYIAYVDKSRYLESKCRYAVSRFAQDSYSLYRDGQITREIWEKVCLTMDDHLRVLNQFNDYNYDFNWLLSRDRKHS